MIEDNNLNEDNNLIAADGEGSAQQRTSTPGERAAVAERVALHRARKAKAEARAQLLSEKQSEKIQSATAATFAKIFSRLTAEQKLALEIGTEELPNLQDLNAFLFEVTALSDLEMFAEPTCRPDIAKEVYDGFIETFPFAKDLVQPRAWYADRDYRNGFVWYVAHHLYSIKSNKLANGTQRFLIDFDPDAPVQFSLDQFFSAVKRYKKWKEQTPRASTIVQEEPVKRKRGRPSKTTKPATETKPVVDPTEVAKYSQPPPVPQHEYWSGKRIAGLIKEQQEEAGLPTEAALRIGASFRFENE